MSSLLTPLALEQELSRQLVEASSGRPRAMSATIVVIPPAQSAAHSLEINAAHSGSEPAAADDPGQLAGLLRGKRPVRLVQARSGSADEGIRASTRCAIDRQSRGVCIEDIIIETTTDEAVDGALWGPFVIRDLPAILFWQRDLRELARCADDCAHRVDLVLVDGEALVAEGSSIADCARFMHSLEAEGLVVRDLAWERLHALRRASVHLVAEGETAREQKGGPGGTISLDHHVPAPWSRALFDAWLSGAIAKSGQEVGVRANDALEPWSLEVSTGDDSFRRSTGIQTSDEGAIFTRLIDRPGRDLLWKAAVTVLAGRA